MIVVHAAAIAGIDSTAIMLLWSRPDVPAEVQAKVRQGKQLAEAYKIDGVPTLGIHGRFFTSPSVAGGPERALQVADALIQRAAKG